MAKKDKKGGAKAAALAAKKAKQQNKATKKSKAKAAKLDGSDAEEDVDLDEVLAAYARAQAQHLQITEVVAPGPPPPRGTATFLASPAHSNQLLLFGGEYFNGALATFFNDLHVYHVDRDQWRTVTSPNAPLPRSGHAWCRGGHAAASVFLFGGEFSSPKQGTFYHYNDFWRLDAAAREWTRLEPKGKTPPARSGHRMTYYKQYIVLFGGFQDTASNTKYLADLWLYDTAHFVWFQPVLPPAQLRPEPRSSCTLLPHEQGAVLFGGYSRVKATAAAAKGGRGGFSGTKSVLRPVVHQDCFFLRITAPAADAPPNTPPVVRWEKRKKPANAPEPTRAGATMVYHKGRGILFGGVHDVEESEEAIESEFFNGLFAWNVERNRFFPLTLRKPRQHRKKDGGGDERVGRRGRGQAREDELLRQLAALETGKTVDEAGEVGRGKKEGEENSDDEDRGPMREMPVTLEPPHPRFNAHLAVQDDVLYIYGGTFEKGDREFTFDDMYAIDLGKMDGCREVFKRETQDWIESEDEEDEDGEEDEDYEDRDDSDSEDADVEMRGDGEPTQSTASKRRKKADEVSNAGTESTESTESSAASTAPTEEEESEADTAAAPVDDTLPQPRPFESRRDFFERTSAEWQEVLMESLRWKGIQPETLTIKELKAKAYRLSEEKWWDSREWITAMEDEQEAAGISEVIALADRGGGGGGAGAGGTAGARRR